MKTIRIATPYHGMKRLGSCRCYLFALSTLQSLDISFPSIDQDDEIQSQAASINQLKQQISDMEDVSRFVPSWQGYSIIAC